MRRAARARARVLLSLAAGTCLAGCSEQPAISSAMAAASSHFVAFERFERWALRSVASDMRQRGKHALRETLFAPLRRDPEVLWAEVQWEQEQLVFQAPIADAQLKFVPIEAPELGRVLVALCDECARASQRRECVVIERPETQRPARVRMAFCRAELETTKPAVELRSRATAPRTQPPSAATRARVAHAAAR